MSKFAVASLKNLHCQSLLVQLHIARVAKCRSHGERRNYTGGEKNVTLHQKWLAWIHMAIKNLHCWEHNEHKTNFYLYVLL